jgi:Ca-activated chloride channel family protein
MRRYLLLVLLALGWTGLARAQGMLVPTDTTVANLTLVNHEVNVSIEDQVAVTKVVQTFRNHTSRALEADYIFPVPAGASVKKFTMWVDGKEVPGELVEADQARQIYTDIVRRTQDPGLLEYLGNNLLRVRVFPVPANGEQKLSVCFTSIAESVNGVVEYTYPLKHGSKTAQSVEHFSVDVSLKSQQPIHNIYSPSHQVSIKQTGDRQATVHFECGQPADADHDFQLYYTTDAKDIGLTALFHRPHYNAVPDGGTVIMGTRKFIVPSPDDGYFLMMLSPRAELAKTQTVPRDVVFVLDTSGSMQGKRIIQAKKAMVHCLRGLQPKDRFAMIHFASTVHTYRDKMQLASQSNLEQAERWVNALEPTGGTAINDALAKALAMRPGEAGRNFTIVFFTDGQPTVGETNPDQIIKNVEARNTASTRIFTFGVGDDVNTVLLDQLAERTRAVCTYVRENEDIEDKVSKLYQKISKPVLTDLKLKVDDKVTLSEIYPPQLPDLFHGNQLVILGRYHGKGNATIRLTGMVGNEEREFIYEVHFPKQTKNGKEFVEELWARRKVGYLLGEIRVHGNNKELVDEVVSLAKKYGITTPYTSYLVVPDGAVPVANSNALRNLSSGGNSERQTGMTQIAPTSTAGTPGQPGKLALAPAFVNPTMTWAVPPEAINGPPEPSPYRSAPKSPAVGGIGDVYGSISGTNGAFRESGGGLNRVETVAPSATVVPTAVPQSGSQAVDYAVAAQDLQRQDQVTATAVRRAAGSAFRQVGQCWVDENFKADMKTIAIKAQGKAYFDILQNHAEARDAFLLGNHVKWVTPSGTVLVIEPDTGRDELNSDEIDALFTAKK